METVNIQDKIPLCSGKKDRNGNEICQGDILENKNGIRFEVRYGIHAMYCPVDDCMMENVGFYVVAEGYYEDMPLGPTEEYAIKIGSIYQTPELKINDRYQCQAGLKTETNEWILCRKRIPEIPDQTDPEDCPEFNVTIEGATKATTLKCSPDGTWFDDFGNVYPVIAWKPLPESWQEQTLAE